MASSLPIPRPPRTPSPPTRDDNERFHTPQPSISISASDIEPTAAGSSWLAPEPAPSSSQHLLAPVPHTRPMAVVEKTDDNGDAQAAHNPFNFEPQVISTSPVKTTVGQRRGHRYKHSSVSAHHNIFQEPPPRPPPVLPASLPVPTIREAWNSMSTNQKTRLYWCLCHLAVASMVFFDSEESLAMTALSHLVFFDAGSAAVCVAVDVLGNFEVWRRSSIRHPFGLQRAEVLAGFAMSIFLLFGGFDLVSHEMKHMLEGLGDHEPHHEHSHERVSPGTVDWACAGAIASTVVSAYGLSNHKHIARIMRVSYLAHLPSILSNPFHFLTVSVSSLLLILPLLSIEYFTWLDRLLCTTIAASMFLLGMRIAVAQGRMLLMSYSGGSGSPEGVNFILREIESEPAITRVDEAQFWQVHYGLGMANLRVRVASGADEMTLSKLRHRIASLVQKHLGGGYGHGTALHWEVTLQMSPETS